MSQAITKIKGRIKSVNGAYKVTSAMKLVSSVKLHSWKSKMLANKAYTNEINNAVNDVFRYLDNVNDPLVISNNKSKKNLYIVVSSSLGLCGSYNSNIFSLANSNINKEDEVILLGKKAITHFDGNAFKTIDEFSNYTSIKDLCVIKSLTNYVKNEFIKGKYKQVHILYTEYVNPITFKAVDKILLPLKKEENVNNNGIPPLLEPNKNELIKSISSFYLDSIIYAYLLESEVSEQASRSNAMENATDNAEELLNELNIEFNKARQGAITQEIIEIVGAASSL